MPSTALRCGSNRRRAETLNRASRTDCAMTESVYVLNGGVAVSTSVCDHSIQYSRKALSAGPSRKIANQLLIVAGGCVTIAFPRLECTFQVRSYACRTTQRH